MENEQDTMYDCPSCNQSISLRSKFCKHCGSAQPAVAPKSYDKNLLTGLIIFYCIEFAICAIIAFGDNMDGLKTLLTAEVIMAVSAIAFSLTIIKELRPLFVWNNFSFKKLGIYALIAASSSLVVQYLAGLLNIALYDYDNYRYFAFIDYKFPFLLMLLLTAVTPAIFEEIAYRGFVLGALLKLIEKRHAIFISSFVFALIHFSIFSMLWIIPFAIILAHIRIKENTIWYGVFIHFTFNAVSCMYEYINLFYFD